MFSINVLYWRAVPDVVLVRAPTFVVVLFTPPPPPLRLTLGLLEESMLKSRNGFALLKTLVRMTL